MVSVFPWKQNDKVLQLERELSGYPEEPSGVAKEKSLMLLREWF